MRIVRGIAATILALVIVLTAASVAYNLLTSDPNVPVRQLWPGKFVSADGVLTAYRQWGTHGTPIVLVGGFLEPSFVWTQVGPKLAAAGHRVYALDLDGFGYSRRRGPSTLQEWSDQVQEFAKALRLEKPLVVGHSLGAAVAVEEARRGVASRAVLLDGDALRSGGPPKLLRLALVHTPFFTTAYRVLINWDWVVRRVLENAYGPHGPDIDSAEVRRWTDQFRAQDARKGLQRVVRNGIVGFSRSELRRLHVRATVIWGSNDDVDDVDSGRKTARDLGAQFVEIPDAGHLSPLERPALVASAIAP
jgi:pimeloyl-ACP methyl ester carboxylesterase